MVSGTEYVGMEVMLKWFGEYKGNKNNWPYPEALHPQGPYSNYFLKIEIIEVGICMLLLQDGHFSAKDSWILNA